MQWPWTRKTVEDRGLFAFSIGERRYLVDALRCWRGLLLHEKFNAATMLPLVLESHEPESTIFAEAMCEIFGLTRWDGQQGATDSELLSLYVRFDAYLAAVKKKVNPPPTSSPPSDSPPGEPSAVASTQA